MVWEEFIRTSRAADISGGRSFKVSLSKDVNGRPSDKQYASSFFACANASSASDVKDAIPRWWLDL